MVDQARQAKFMSALVAEHFMLRPSTASLLRRGPPPTISENPLMTSLTQSSRPTD